MNNQHKFTTESLIQLAGFNPIENEENCFIYNSINEPNIISDDSPLKITEWKIKKRASSWLTTVFCLELKLDQFKRCLTENLLKQYGNKTIVDIVINDIGEMNVSIEYTKSRGKRISSVPVSEEGNCYLTPHGHCGFKASISCEKTNILINIFDLFSIGNCPPDIFLELPDIVQNSFHLDGSRSYPGLYEQKYSIGKLVQILLSKKIADQKSEQFLNKGVGEHGFAKKSSFLCEFNTKKGWTYKFSENKIYIGSLYQPSLEVLEERELPQFKSINRYIVTQNIVPALKLIEPEIKANKNNVYITRRIGILYLCGYSEIDLESLEYAIGLEPENKLFLSCYIKKYLNDRKDDLLEKKLDQLKSSFENSKFKISELKSFEMVPLELYADSIFNSNSELSEEIYESILQKRGELPRVLSKLTRLTRYMKDEAKERELLNRLLKVERRPNMQVYIFFQLAKLFRPISFEQAIEYGMKALEISPNSKEVALLVANIKTDNNLPHEAIQTLTDALSSMDANRQKMDKAELELAIGRIWQNSLNRSDLADKRYENALNLIGPNKNFLIELSDIYKDSNNSSGYEKVLNLLLELELKSNSEEQVFRYMDSLLKIYIGTRGDFQSAFKLYLKILDYYILPISVFSEILSWDIEENLWKSIYEKCHRFDLSSFDSNVKFYYNLIFAKILRDKLSDMESALNYFFESVNYEKLEYSDLQSIKEYCFEVKKPEIFSDILQCQLNFLDGKEYIDTITDLLSSKHGLPNKKIDELAINLYQFDKDQVEVLKNRIKLYQSENNFELLDNILNLILENTTENDLKENWLRFVCEELVENNSPKKFEYIENYVHKMLMIANDRISVLEKGVLYLHQSNRKKMIENLLVELIDSKIIPNLEESKTLNSLSDFPLHQSKYYQMKMIGCENEESIKNYSQKSWDILSKMEGLNEEKEIALFSLGKYVDIPPNTKNSLNKLVEISQHWPEYIYFLKNQIGLSKNSEIANGLRRELISIYDNKYDDTEKVLEIYDDICTDSDQPELIIFEIAEYALSKKISNLREYILSCIYNEICWQHTEWMKKVFLWLIVDLKDITTVKHVLVTKIKDIANKGDLEKSCFYGDILIDYNILNMTICWNCFQFAIKHKNKENIYKYWSAYASLLSNPSEVREFITECQQIFEIAKLENTLKEIIIQGINEGFLFGLSFAAENEFKIYYAKYLFDRKEEPETAISIYKDYYNIRPDDSRIWISYFFLLKDNEYLKESVSLLNEIIPRIERNEELIKDFPVTVESLKKDLAALYIEAQSEVGTKTSSRNKISSESMISTHNNLERSEVGEFNELQKVSGDTFHKSNKDIGKNSISPVLSLKYSKKDGSTPAEGSSSEKNEELKDFPNSSDKKVMLSTDWRYVVSNFEYFKDMTKALYNKSFENELEKHIAIQAFSLISGETGMLKKWPYKVWRSYKDYNYSIVQDRLPEKIHELKSNKQIELILNLLNPIVKKIYFEEFSVKKISKIFRCKDEQIINERKPILWTDVFFKASGIRVYIDQFNKINFNCFHLSGLNDQILFIPENNAIYFDQKFYSDKPTTHLQHKILQIWNQVDSGKYYWLNLHPVKQVFSLIEFCSSIIQNSKINKLKMKIGIERNPYVKELFKLDLDQLSMALTNTREINKKSLTNYFDKIREFLYMKQLSDTLDLVGISEWVLKVDILKEDPEEIRQKVMSNELILYLVKNTAKILV